VVDVGQDAACVVLRVRDTGVGIPCEHLPYVFERFYRVDAARSPRGGAGLGLAICRWIARAHGGDICMRSAVGEGTEVMVRLPLDGAVAPASASDLEQAVPESARIPG
jgi:signal transduction histidine kinase